MGETGHPSRAPQEEKRMLGRTDASGEEETLQASCSICNNGKCEEQDGRVDGTDKAAVEV